MTPLCLLVPWFLLQQGHADTNACDFEDDEHALLQASLAREAAVLQSSEGMGKHGIITRPNTGKGADNISFGVRAKAFYGLSLRTNTFVMDVVMTLRWTDKRVTKLIPKGLANLTLTEGEAKKMMWLPQVTVTNRDIRKVEVISIAVVIHKAGNIEKVERLLVNIKQRFMLADYPFDTQHLEVKIASSKYMISELVLVPSSDKQISGLNKGLFAGKNYYVQHWNTSAFEDDDGALKKSRGMLKITAHRVARIYFNMHLIPSIGIILLSCAVFWLPFLNPFITPRLAISILALLTFTNLARQSNSALPPEHPSTWNDIINRNIQILMVINCCLNAYTEVRFHVTKVEQVARRMNRELKYGSLVLNAFVVTSIVLCANLELLTHHVMDYLTMSILGLSLVGYLFYCEHRSDEAVKAREQEEAQANK
jgi:hypothetical protein